MLAKTRLDKPFANERASFKLLQLSNPNYFGTLKDSPLKPVVPIKGNTYYEELGCVGYQPQQKMLEGVVYVYQPSGYGTDICGPGTTEYVRFFTSVDNGATWKDQGITSFQAHNVPEGTEGPARLEYAVSLPAELKANPCTSNPLVKVRAILSWNDPPQAGNPNWTPVWGNVREATILVEPRRFFFLPELLNAAKVQIPPYLEDLVDLQAPIPTLKKSMDAAELSRAYKGKVPAGRLAYKQLMEVASGKASRPLATPLPMPMSAKSGFLPAPKTAESLGIKLDAALIEGITLAPADGNTTYEELRCIGLDPNFPSTLVGVIQVKKESGYSGGPCSDGSLEHVAFWADFDGNGSFETHLGTATVRVYDVQNTPDEGICYAVRLPVDLDQYRQECKKGPRIVRIRAILSWATPPSSTNPNHVPAWGNREETTILVGPSSLAPAGKIAILGGVATQYIHDATGMTVPGAKFANNDAIGYDACPFGGRVEVRGLPMMGHKYKVEVVPAAGGVPIPLVTPLELIQEDGTTYMHHPDSDGRFQYVASTLNAHHLLALWPTTGDDLWKVKLTVYDGAGNPVGSPDTHRVQLDNTAPTVSIDIVSGSGNCGKFGVGETLSGMFVATDANMGGYSLSIEPNPASTSPPGMGQVAPHQGFSNTAPAPGDGWSLDTKDLSPCGYVIRVVASDRTIVNSRSVGRHASDSAGFCLEQK